MPTSCSANPNAHAISVAEGRNETMRRGGAMVATAGPVLSLPQTIAHQECARDATHWGNSVWVRSGLISGPDFKPSFGNPAIKRLKSDVYRSSPHCLGKQT